MKFLIKENQIETTALKLKPIVFQYWNKNGPTLSRTFHKMIGLNSSMTYALTTYFQDYLIEWFGGDKNFEEFVKKIEGEVYHVVVGGYDFKFILDEISFDDFQVYLYVRVLRGGTVTLIFDENEPTLPLENAIGDDKYGWEISSEVTESIYEKLANYFSNLGITIEDLTVDYM